MDISSGVYCFKCSKRIKYNNVKSSIQVFHSTPIKKRKISDDSKSNIEGSYEVSNINTEVTLPGCFTLSSIYPDESKSYTKLCTSCNTKGFRMKNHCNKNYSFASKTDLINLSSELKLANQDLCFHDFMFLEKSPFDIPTSLTVSLISYKLTKYQKRVRGLEEIKKMASKMNTAVYAKIVSITPNPFEAVNPQSYTCMKCTQCSESFRLGLAKDTLDPNRYACPECGNSLCDPFFNLKMTLSVNGFEITAILSNKDAAIFFGVNPYIYLQNIQMKNRVMVILRILFKSHKNVWFLLRFNTYSNLFYIKETSALLSSGNICNKFHCNSLVDCV